MTTSEDYINWILDSLDNKKVSLRKMFGEYAVYFDKKVVGFVCDNTFFLKINDNSTELLSKNHKNIKYGPAYPGSKDYYILSEEILENKKFVNHLLEVVSFLVIEKKKKPNK